ncbi:hypothetical protein BKA61DRAFT_687587 [Leptodontidium sp. MPI-SDFR-AT-0119]|nr:hypothetical protein BKA61DRAFT_687587 [Leptodontidium sp. MPI-SDFR-AT-0119]
MYSYTGRCFSRLLLPALLLLRGAHAQIQILNVTANEFPMLTSTCLAVLNQAVACDQAVTWAGRGRFEDDATLTALCTAACTTAITTWHRRVAGACTTRFNDGAGFLVLPQIWSEQYIEEYNLVCLQHNGLFCNAVIRDKAGMNPVNQLATATPGTNLVVATLPCEDCAIKSISAKLQLQRQSQPEYAVVYSSLTSSCKKTTFTFTPIVTTTYSISATGPIPSGQPTGPTAVPTNQPCVGTSYTIKATDTCKSISKSNGISTEWMLRTNSLAPYCSQFPAAGKAVCIDTNHKCKTYTVKDGDTCGTIGDAIVPALTWTQVMIWNPELGPGCAKISSYVGYEICIERPGGNWVDPEPTDEPSPTTVIPEPTRTGTPIHLLPQPVYTGLGNHTVWVFANGTRRDCQRYTTGAEMQGNNTCAQVAAAFDVRLEDELKLWNPSLETASPCVLNMTEQYCAQVTLHTAANITQYCVLKNYALPGVNLKSFMAAMGIQQDQFAAWNPTVKADGSGYKSGYEYCVMVQHFRQPGIISTCNQFVKAEEWLLDMTTVSRFRTTGLYTPQLLPYLLLRQIQLSTLHPHSPHFPGPPVNLGVGICEPT